MTYCLGKSPNPAMHRFSYASRCTPLHYAAYNGNLGGVEFLMKHGADIASATHPHRMTPAQLAEMQGHKAAAEKLRSQ